MGFMGDKGRHVMTEDNGGIKFVTRESYSHGESRAGGLLRCVDQWCAQCQSMFDSDQCETKKMYPPRLPHSKSRMSS